MVKMAGGLQDDYLNQLRKENIPATFYLINGFQLKAVVKGFDNFIVLIDSDGRQQMIYKHAISTITPSKQFNLQLLTEEDRVSAPGRQENRPQRGKQARGGNEEDEILLSQERPTERFLPTMP